MPFLAWPVNFTPAETAVEMQVSTHNSDTSGDLVEHSSHCCPYTHPNVGRPVALSKPEGTELKPPSEQYR